MTNEQWSTMNEYRFGFNGMEKDDEAKGAGNSYDFGARIYDSRLGRFYSLDPLMNMQPFISPYSFAWNQPIWAIDANGELRIILTIVYTNSDGTQSTSTSVIYDKNVLEEENGQVYSTVHLRINKQIIMVSPNESASYAHARDILVSSSYIGGLDRRGQAYEANLIAGAAWDFVMSRPFAKLMEASVGENFNSGADINGFERASKVFGAALDVVAWGKGQTIEQFFGVETTISLAEKFGQKEVDKFLSVSGLNKNEWVALGWGLAKLFLKKELDPKDEQYVTKLLSEVLTGAKTLTDFYGTIYDKYKIKISDIEHGTKDEAIDAMIQKYGGKETIDDFSIIDSVNKWYLKKESNVQSK